MARVDFPKSLNIGKAIDKLAGAEREVVGVKEDYLRRKPNGMKTPGATAYNYSQAQQETNADITAPATEAAKQWDGWGSALKPSHEPIVVARKPLSESSIARNALKWGCGGLNIDQSRVRAGGDHAKNCNRSAAESHWRLNSSPRQPVEAHAAGRFPANLLLSHSPNCQRVGVKRVKGSKLDHFCTSNSPQIQQMNDAHKKGHTDPDGYEQVEEYSCVESCPVLELGRQSGVSKSNKRKHKGNYGGVFGNGHPVTDSDSVPDDEGSAARFFQQFTPDTGAGFRYVPKSSKRERNAGLEGMPEHETSDLTRRKPGSKGLDGDSTNRGQTGNPYAGSSGKPRTNVHPCVKPLALMRYLVKLITPPNGTILDPFCGSGSTGCAAVLEGFNFIGIEQDESYVEIAEKRIAYCSQPEEPKTEQALF